MTVVILDAHELQKDWLCKGLKYQLLRHNQFYPPIEVRVPAVVLEELVANHDREVTAARAAIDGSERKLARLGVKSSVAHRGRVQLPRLSANPVR